MEGQEVQECSDVDRIALARTRRPNYQPLSRFERSTHWDLKALGGGARALSTEGDNTESRLLGIVDAMKPDGHYQYDAATYVVYSPRIARATVAHPYAFGWSPVWWAMAPRGQDRISGRVWWSCPGLEIRSTSVTGTRPERT